MSYKILRNVEREPDHPISARIPDLVSIDKKKRTCPFEGFVILTDHRVKVKEGEKLNEFMDLETEKWLWYQ